MYQNLPNIYNMIIENIETSKNLSKMVKKINLLGIAESDIGHQLPEKAENIEENVQLGTKKFQLSNKYNPKMKFSICQKQNTTEGGIDIEVEKIN
ncbi:unnamed protein product [Meloidogyne enterolobii]|uniref:Uncharacterized protein n=1 Tax=Meloidogyne enterolobii TaxID=390850 RepID=A0ACB0XTP7_MELEN